MDETLSLKSLAELFVLPPANLFLLFLAGVLIARRRQRLGRAVQYAAVALLYALSTPLIAGSLLRTLETATPLDLAAIQSSGAGAVVVLSGEMAWTPEYGGGATVGSFTLERVRYAARVARATSLPVLVAGGVLKRGAPPIAELMRDALKDFGISPRWVEARSQTTDQNARFSAALLRSDGIDTVVLVTNGFHMRRSTLAFAQAGLTVIPAATMLTAPET
jgi:uncharacterized SAM-binding protein YcdF (DUF218 family)